MSLVCQDIAHLLSVVRKKLWMTCTIVFEARDIVKAVMFRIFCFLFLSSPCIDLTGCEVIG